MSDHDTIESHIKDYQTRKLWGSVEFEFQNGRLTFIRKRETLVIPRENNSVGARGDTAAYHRDVAAVHS